MMGALIGWTIFGIAVVLVMLAAAASAKKADTAFNYDDPEALAHRARL